MKSTLKIGLALGSGSARGWAHIGVIKALLKAQIPIHCIAGCSMGSVVGAIYASGHFEEFEEWALKLNKSQMAKLLDFKFSGGMISGTRLMDLLKNFGLDQTIEELKIPFGAVATDLNSGREVWLTQGSVMQAIRSSIALPGVLNPVCYQDTWLVDGGLVNPVPVSLCRALGANFVIAVNLNHDLFSESSISSDHSSPGSVLSEKLGKMVKDFFSSKENPGFYEVLTKSIKIMQDRITRAREAGDPAEFTLYPELGNLSLYEFDKAKVAIHSGEVCVRQSLHRLTHCIGIKN